MSNPEVLDPNAEIMGTDDMGGFELPPVGDIKDGTGVIMVFTGEIADCGENNQSLGFELGYVDDPSRKARVFCKTTTSQGLSRIVGLGKNSGVFKKINDKRVKGGKTSILTANGGVKTKILQDAKFHAQLRAEIEGCTLLCTITHSDAKPYTDKETGEEKEGFPQANITKTAPADAKAATKATAKGATVTPDAAGGDEEEWEE